jgi:hypothetical protein
LIVELGATTATDDGRGRGRTGPVDRDVDVQAGLLELKPVTWPHTTAAKP